MTVPDSRFRRYLEVAHASMIQTLLWSEADCLKINDLDTEGDTEDLDLEEADLGNRVDLEAGDLELSDQARTQSYAGLAGFLSDMWGIVREFDPAQVGHDFWLTTQGHGAGFWAGDYPEAAGKLLTSACADYPQVFPYIGDDGLVYLG